MSHQQGSSPLEESSKFLSIFINSSTKIYNFVSVLLVYFHSFLLVNSVALHGDHCPICQRVEEELYKLSHALNCSFQVIQILDIIVSSVTIIVEFLFLNITSCFLSFF